MSTLELADRTLLPVMRALRATLREKSLARSVAKETEMLRKLKAAQMAGCRLPRWWRLCALLLPAFMLPSLSFSRGVSRIATSTMLRKS